MRQDGGSNAFRRAESRPPAPTLGDDIEKAVRSVAQQLGYSRKKMLRVIVREWLEQNAYLPVLYLNDEGEDGGNP